MKQFFFILFLSAVVYVLAQAQERHRQKLLENTTDQLDYFIYFAPAPERGKMRLIAVKAENRYFARKYLDARFGVLSSIERQRPFVVPEGEIVILNAKPKSQF